MLLPLYKGKLLFIGDTLDSCTFIHGVEDIVKPPYIRQVKSSFTVNGVNREYTINDNYGWGSEFQRIEYILATPDIRNGKLLSANACLIDTCASFGGIVKNALRALRFRNRYFGIYLSIQKQGENAYTFALFY